MTEKNEMQYVRLGYDTKFLVRQSKSRLIDLLTSQKKVKHDEAETLLDDYVTFKVAEQSGLDMIRGGESFIVKQTTTGE
jgi:hypothetical protein